MGDVPLLTCISSSTNQPNVTELIQGVASETKTAFELDGQLTQYIDFTTNATTQATVYSAINDLFSIRCPPSISNAQLTTSIVYVEEFETGCTFDETSIQTNAFCGQCSSNDNTLVSSNTRPGDYLCFAYRLLNSYVVSIGVNAQVNGDTTTTISTSISFSPQADRLWHYTCVNVRAQLVAQSSISSSASSLIITKAWLNNNIRKGIFVDSVTLRISLPVGYEDVTTYPVDQPASPSSCTFPFTYNGNSYQACTLDNNSLPICVNMNTNVTYSCQVSSIEGVRRLYPKHQLVYNTLAVAYTTSPQRVTATFRYSDCVNPALIVPYPSAVNFSYENL